MTKAGAVFMRIALVLPRVFGCTRGAQLRLALGNFCNLSSLATSSFTFLKCKGDYLDFLYQIHLS